MNFEYEKNGNEDLIFNMIVRKGIKILTFLDGSILLITINNWI